MATVTVDPSAALTFRYVATHTVYDIHDAVGVHGNACVCGQTVKGVPCTSTFTDRSIIH
jgi:hypothetical protein